MSPWDQATSSLFNTQRIDHIYDDPQNDDADLILHYGDLGSLNLQSCWGGGA